MPDDRHLVLDLKTAVRENRDLRAAVAAERARARLLEQRNAALEAPRKTNPKQ